MGKEIGCPRCARGFAAIPWRRQADAISANTPPPPLVTVPAPLPPTNHGSRLRWVTGATLVCAVCVGIWLFSSARLQWPGTSARSSAKSHDPQAFQRLYEEAVFSWFYGNSEDAKTKAEEACMQANSKQELATAFYFLGEIAAIEHDHGLALVRYNAAISHDSTVGRYYLARAQSMYAELAKRSKDYDGRLTHQQQIRFDLRKAWRLDPKTKTDVDKLSEKIKADPNWYREPMPG